MENTLGRRIADLRRQRDLTQEEVAQAMNVSSQAVSKWENDLSCPDVLALPQLAKLLGVTVDELLGGDRRPEVRLVPQQERKPVEEMTFRIVVNSSEGDRVRVNLPMALVQAALELGLSLPQVSGSALKDVDLEKVMELVRMGLSGRLIEVDSANGDHVIVEVE